MTLEMWNKLSFLLTQYVAVVLSASYHQREYSGYLFTIPGFNDAERRLQIDAQTWCNQNGSSLLTIPNSDVQNAVVAFINDAIRQNQMTGNSIVTDGKRQKGEWMWINGSKTSLQFQGQDGTFNKIYAYLYTVPSGLTLFADKQTEGKNYYICEGSVFCGFGYEYQSQCFQSFGSDAETVSWFEARNRCLQRGGDLATFEFISTNEGLSILNGSWISPLRQYWIGAQRERWTWQSTNSNITYSQWSVGHPIYDVNQNCLCLLPNTPTYDWKWSECQCEQRYQFVCISSRVTTLPSPSRTSHPFSSSISSSNSNNFNFQSYSHSNAISTLMTTKGSSSNVSSVSDEDANKSLAIGLGVGIGGGVLLIAIVVIIIFLLSRKGYDIHSFRRKHKTKEVDSHPLPDVTTVYAEIPKANENEAVASFAKQQQSLPPPSQIEYASLEIVTDRTNTSPESDITITNLNRGTLAPPHSRTILVLDEVDGGGQEYGQITKKKNKGK